MSFAEFFNTLKEARFGFGVMRDAISDLYYAVTANPNIQSIWNWIMNLIRPMFTFAVIVVIAFCLISAFFGKKMMGMIKFLFCFVVGFALGVHLLASIIPAVVKIPAWVTGLVVGLLAAVLYRFIYYIFYAVAIGYSSYILFYYIFFLVPAPVYTTFRAIVCTALAILVVIIAFALRKYVEMAATACLGAWLATMYFLWFIYDFRTLAFLKGIEWVGILVVSALIALPGFIVQVKTRKRY